MLEQKVNSFKDSILSVQLRHSTTIGPQGTVTFIEASSYGDAIALQRTDRVFVSSSEHRDSFSYVALNVTEMIQ
jgi:hypothetical protein